MAKLTRLFQKIFASDAGPEERAQIGSMAAGTPAYSTDPATIQALANYQQGLFGVVVGENSPALEDINSLYFLITRQLAYLYQSGMPEWDGNTEYFIGDFVRFGMMIYQSAYDDNIGNVPGAVGEDFWTACPIQPNLMPNGYIPQEKVTANYVESAAVTNYSENTAPGSFVPGLEVTITTTGKPVEISLLKKGTFSSSVQFSLQGAAVTGGGVVYFVRSTDGGPDEFVGSQNIAISNGNTLEAINVPSSAFRHIDTPPAGTHTYKINVNVPDAPSGIITLFEAAVCAREL